MVQIMGPTLQGGPINAVYLFSCKEGSLLKKEGDYMYLNLFDLASSSSCNFTLSSQFYLSTHMVKRPDDISCLSARWNDVVSCEVKDKRFG